MFFSDQLSAGVLTDDETQTIDPYCGHNTPPLVSPEPEGWLTEPPYRNLFLRKDLSVAPAYSMVNRTPATAIPADAQLQDASSDFSRVIFSESAALTANAPAGEALYGWEANDVTLVSVLPTGTAVAGQIVDPAVNAQTGAAPYMHGASANGETIFFTYGDDLYARTNAFKPASAFTLQLDESANGGPGGGGRFLAANAAGTRAFFMDGPAANLTSDTQAGGGQNLYEYNLASHELTDLTAVEHADVLGVAGWGENAAGEGHLYFVAEGALASGATEGEPNLYVAGDGQTEYVAPLNAATDHTDWTPPDQLSARVSPDGELLAFDSAASVKTAAYPGGYDNLDTATEELDEEIYLFDARTKSTTCLSCRPGGARPENGGAELPRPAASGGFGGGPGYLQRNVLDNGRVFFQTAEALVPQDVNLQLDVYEFSEGVARLISTGTSGAPSMFGDVSESGDDVFFATTQPLVKRDTDNALSLYDARVGGGFAEPASPVGCQSADGCRGGERGAAIWTMPASATFSGAGDLPLTTSNAQAHNRVWTQKHKLARALEACSRKRSKPGRRRCRRKARARYAIAHRRRDQGKTVARRQRRGRRSGK